MRNFTVEEALEIAGIGRTILYREFKLGRITAIKVGRRTLIPEQSLRAWQQRLIDEAEARQTKVAA